jgi:hypothetical protein
MNRGLLLSIYFLLSLGLSAQHIVLDEYFDEGVPFPPEGWTIIDVNGDSYNWSWDFFDELNEQYAVSESWKEGPGPLAPDNFLITPKLYLGWMTGQLTLHYSIGAASSNYFAEHYQLTVSTTDTQPSSFRYILHEETLTEELGDAWGPRAIDISGFLDSSIYIAWRHYNCTDQYKLMLDSIVVVFTGNLGVSESKGTEINVNPNPAHETMTVSGNFKNADISLFSITGIPVIQALNVSGRVTLNVTSLATGLYFLRISHEGGGLTKKVRISK